MCPPEPSTVTGPPPRIGLDITPKCVPGGARLVDRVDPDLLPAASLPPGLAVVPELATLDLDDDQPRPRQKDDQVGLVVLSVVGGSLVRVEDILRAQLLAQEIPDLALAPRREPRPLGHQHRHRRLLPLRLRSQLRPGRQALLGDRLPTGVAFPLKLTGRPGTGTLRAPTDAS